MCIRPIRWRNRSRQLARLRSRSNLPVQSSTLAVGIDARHAQSTGRIGFPAGKSMFNRENWVGVALVGLCGVAAIVLLIEIFTDYTFTYSGPAWFARVIALGGTGLVLLMTVRALKTRFGRRGGPGTPRGGPSWPQNDLPGRSRWPQSPPPPAPPETGESDTSDPPTTSSPR